MKQCVVGFYFFGADRQYVTLIRKRKPESRAGKLNGVGGAIEPGESAPDAMVREFAEETSKQTKPVDWRFFASLRTNGNEIFFFSASGSPDGINTLTEEGIERCPVTSIPYLKTVLPNLRWLIPLALNNEPPVVIIQ